jgi:hypothetical protein
MRDLAHRLAVMVASPDGRSLFSFLGTSELIYFGSNGGEGPLIVD